MLRSQRTTILPGSYSATLEKAKKLLQAGQVVAFPTDTVYGVGVDAFNPHAINKLFAIKARDRSKAIAILVGDFNALSQITSELSSSAKRLAKYFFPGAITLVVASHPGLPNNISPNPTVGVRMPNHPIALDLLKLFGPIATTSANISGQSSPTTAREVFNQLQGRVPLILDGGQTPGGTPSTVVDCTGVIPVILREGAICEAKIMAVASCNF
jgi:L-threonylcarbamoyladenylate synthase